MYDLFNHVKSVEAGIKITEIIAERLSEGLVLIDRNYKVLCMNRYIRKEFGYIELNRNDVDTKTYFDFFFNPCISEIEKRENLSARLFDGDNDDPITGRYLAINNNYYDIVAYPLQEESPPKLVLEIWSKFGTEQFYESINY